MIRMTASDLMRLADLMRRGEIEVVRHEGAVALLAVLKPRSTNRS